MKSVMQMKSLLCSDEIKSTHRCSDFIRSKGGFHHRRWFHPPARVDLVEKARRSVLFLVRVGRRKRLVAQTLDRYQNWVAMSKILTRKKRVNIMQESPHASAIWPGYNVSEEGAANGPLFFCIKKTRQFITEPAGLVRVARLELAASCSQTDVGSFF